MDIHDREFKSELNILIAFYIVTSIGELFPRYYKRMSWALRNVLVKNWSEVKSG